MAAGRAILAGERTAHKTGAGQGIYEAQAQSQESKSERAKLFLRRSSRGSDETRGSSEQGQPLRLIRYTCKTEGTIANMLGSIQVRLTRPASRASLLLTMCPTRPDLAQHDDWTTINRYARVIKR